MIVRPARASSPSPPSTAPERKVITAGDAAEVLGTSSEEIRQLLARPAAAENERRLHHDLEEAVFGKHER